MIGSEKPAGVMPSGAPQDLARETSTLATRCSIAQSGSENVGTDRSENEPSGIQPFVLWAERFDEAAGARRKLRRPLPVRSETCRREYGVVPVLCPHAVRRTGSGRPLEHCFRKGDSDPAAEPA